jgi:hypothetical protein
MHHLKETVIDGVKFVLIPEELHDALAKHIEDLCEGAFSEPFQIAEMWAEYDPEIFDGE